MDTNSGTIEFTGDGDVGADTYTVTTLSTTYYSLIINSTDGATDIFQLGAALDINNSLTITAGDFDVTTDNRAITVGGNFARVGTFTQRSGTVTFDDATKTSIISGSTTFNNFTCVTQDKNFQFTAASTQTISGTLTLTGAADHLIVLRSTSTDSYWNLIAGASQAVTYVDVKDSDASGGTIVNPGLNSTDSGHNLNWQFQPVVTWSAASQSGAESAGTMTVTANLSYAYASDVTIPYTITGTATATTDYTITASPLVITAGNTSGAITITVVDDTIDELDETVIVTMGDPTNGTKGTTSVHTATITDNDAAPTIAINDPTVSESAGTGTVTVTLTGGSYLGVTVDYATSSGTAISGTDFTATSGTLTWAANETGTKTFTVTITNDILDENDETLTLTLSNPSNSTIADSTGVLTIIDNDDAPTVATVTGTQGTDGTGDVTITFIMDDSADDDTLQAKIEYSLNGGIDWADPTISVTNGETLATYGDPSVDNTQTYQVGQTGAYITSSSGANTVSIVWEAATDVSVSTNISNAQIRVTPYDGTEIGTSSLSPDFIVDRTAPSGLASFAYMDFSSSHAVLTWTAATDTNFNHYEIWHGETESQVISRNGSAVEWDNSDDATLVTASTATSTINNTDPRNKYFKIFAVDNYGNELTVTDIYIGGGHSSYSSSGSSSSSGGGSSSSDDDSTTTTTATTVTDTTEDEEPSEEVVEEETDEPEDTSEMTWEDFDVNPPEEHWSEGYVKHLEEQTNIIEVAVSQPSFLDILLSILETPDNPMPRGNALEFLLVLAGYSLDTITINVRSLAFEDLSLDDDQAGFIQFAYEQGLIQGYPDGTFQTDRVVNRAEALKLCSYFFEGDWTHPVYGDDLLALYGLTENPFTDVDLSQWYAPYLINAYAKGVVSGYGDGTFGPANSVTYAEFLKIATLMQNIEDAVELAEELE
ncbi:MAG: Calx-beta domain-containing protein [Candidatus Gracilibacteria bacterium]